MNKIVNFTKRNLKEIIRDPIIYVFCLCFPIIMFLIFYIISKYTDDKTPTFELYSLLPGIIMFSFSFVMLIMALNISKDRQTFFLKRLFSSPMKSYHFVLGYAIVGLIIGMCQMIVCIMTGFIISLVSEINFLSIIEIILLIISQLPILLINIFFGILLGTLFNDKTAPGISSLFISLSGMIGGCWMPIEMMGNFELFCRFMPFYPSVYIGRIISGAKKATGIEYIFDNKAKIGLIVIMIYMIVCVFSTFILFKKKMISDK